MNTNILKKCLEELSKEAPRLDYLRGMLETLVELQDVNKFTYSFNNGTINPDGTFTLKESTPIVYPKGSVGESLNPPVTKDEGALLDATARAAIESVKALAEKSTE